MKKERSERKQYWQGVVAEQEASGKSVRDFLPETDLAEHPFYWWRRHLQDMKPASFALVEAKAGVRTGFELALSSGEVLHIPADCRELAGGVRGIAGGEVIGLPASVRVYLCGVPCDMRRSFDGLHGLVTSVMELDVLAGHLFVFSNRKKDR